jgi:hypothetical protein
MWCRPNGSSSRSPVPKIIGPKSPALLIIFPRALHERFHNIRLPDALAFFGGTRFVPIVTTVVLGLVTVVTIGTKRVPPKKARASGRRML